MTTSPEKVNCRFSYNLETGTLVAKVVPTRAYELAAAKFQTLIEFKLAAMNLDDEVEPLGSTTVTLGSWKKEADCSWAPGSRGIEFTLVVEVGLLESARRLDLDARGWLESSGSPVKIVVTININRTNPEIIIHRWELLPRDYLVSTGSSAGSA